LNELEIKTPDDVTDDRRRLRAMTTRVTIGVKHGKETHDVDVDLDESGATFKARLCSLTNVPIERIKVTGLRGGRPLADDADMRRRASRRWRDEGRNC
jgi:hypothetical protein